MRPIARPAFGGRREIAFVAAKPLPGELGAAHSAEERVLLSHSPVRQIVPVEPHRRSRAGHWLSTQSPRWGNRFVETHHGVAKAARDQLRPADHVIGRPGALHVLVRSFNADSKDGRDFPVRLARSEQPDTLALTPAKMRRAAPGRIVMDPAGGAERMRPDLLRAKQPLEREVGSGAHCEGAGSGGLAGDVDGDGEPVPDSEMLRPLQELALPATQGDQRWELRPAKANVGSNARMMDGIGPDQPAPRKVFLPARRIGVDPNVRWTPRSEARVMKKREEGEAEVSGCMLDQRPEFFRVGAGCRPHLEQVDQPGERQYGSIPPFGDAEATGSPRTPCRIIFK